MSVIVGIDMPKSCAECPICHPKGKDEPWNFACFHKMLDIDINKWDEERHIDCPIKSIDGLINKVYQLDFDYGDYYDHTSEIQDKVIATIREYCEVKE